MNLSYLIDTNIFIFSALVLMISLLNVLYSSYTLGIALLSSLFTGFLISHFLFKEKKKIPNLLDIFNNFFSPSTTSEKVPECCKDKPDVVIDASYSDLNHQTFIRFNVPQSVDQSLEELFNLILDHHVYSWYKDISVHDQFADELRHVIRCATASLGFRLSKIDLSELILDRFLPVALKHVKASSDLSKTFDLKDSDSKGRFEHVVFESLLKRDELHPALHSRLAEANYLRKVVRHLLPFLIPLDSQSSQLSKTFLQELLSRSLILQGMDLLADPDVVNFLFLLLFDNPEPQVTVSEPPEPQVLILRAFATVNTHSRNSTLRCNLSSVLKNKKLSDLFENFLMSEKAMNILSFCLAVEGFNRSILNPDLTEDEMVTLQKDGQDLYHKYMKPEAVYNIDFGPPVVSEIKEIVHGDVTDIVKLRTTRPLFQAYEYGYNLLEKEYLPRFMQSALYFSYVCGSNLQTNEKASTSSSPLKSRDGDSLALTESGVGRRVVRRVGSGLKNLGRQISLKPAVINGDEDMFSDVDEASDVTTLTIKMDLAHLICSNESEECESSPRHHLESFNPSFRDLSAWRVSIPEVEPITDGDNKMEFVFLVDITRIDVIRENADETHWMVARRYHEFYVLESKLTEFHGDLIDVSLPPRWSFFESKGTSFMNSRRQIFEEFLQKLLQKPFLKNSQLLFLFFKSNEEFTASFLPDFSLGRLLKEVPRKLVKEKGQNLDSFINSFIQSASFKSSNPTSNSMEEMQASQSIRDLVPDEDVKLRLSSLYGDNAANFQLGPVPSQREELPETPSDIQIRGFFDIVVFVAVRFLNLSYPWLQFLLPLKVILGNTIDAAATLFLRWKLTEVLVPRNIVKLIHAIRDALFFNTNVQRSPEDIEQRRRKLIEKITICSPKWIPQLILKNGALQDGSEAFVGVFQYPLLNKQLSYKFLDILIEAVFPELTQNIKGESTRSNQETQPVQSYET